MLTPQMEQAIVNAVANTERGLNVRIFCLSDLESSVTPGTTPASIDAAWLFRANGVLFVTKKVGTCVDKVLKKVDKVEGADCGDTAIGDDMFFEVMKPLMARVRKAKREGDNETAFAELFGAALAGTHWAADNECWMDTAFAKFFWEFSDAWRTILALPGPQIAGLVNPWAGQQAVFGGGAGGANPQQQQQLDGLLKQRLSAWLQKWQDDLNSVFDDFDAGSGAGTYKGQTASVTIFP